MDATLTYALIAGVSLVILAVIVKAVLRWTFRIFAFLLVLAALVGGTWLWINYSNQKAQSEPLTHTPRRATTAQH